MGRIAAFILILIAALAMSAWFGMIDAKVDASRRGRELNSTRIARAGSANRLGPIQTSGKRRTASAKKTGTPLSEKVENTPLPPTE